jgi:hypothetical protein
MSIVRSLSGVRQTLGKPHSASSTYEYMPYSGPSFMPSIDMRPGPDT